jgi:hypothetical protein
MTVLVAEIQRGTPAFAAQVEKRMPDNGQCFKVNSNPELHFVYSPSERWKMRPDYKITAAS